MAGIGFELRKILKDGRTDATDYIVTVPKRGYKLVAPVRPQQELVAAEEHAVSSANSQLNPTLSDLSPKDAFFAQELADLIKGSRPVGHSASIEVKSIGLVPDQIGLLKIPLVHGNRGQREEEERYERYLKKCSLDPKNVAELDALEVYYPGGVAAFLVDALSRYLRGDI